ncbi:MULTISPECIES: gamma-glutamylcyclotransferase family protein [Streptomyces]|uniref:gamma-glutamylcyclotransferase family protein n=1 Tax=Streptomyces TaxID=1883 RepID=UPI00163D037D|nr:MULTISPECIES: gamma-glutamylcyclotransferase family protein [Streptomyces]MBC2878651.1 gamma-glutamylcyclotransferase [Streptomyces sp. TYQ1024]UBI35302.1 gamma-glutamylcyclotransferase [Streptomyces mobaraensis]UKW27893.1 gamma-glutamylcyclotransferase [Streptomyces sp. TYQ1024]
MAGDEAPLPVFVYGTLRRDGVNYDAFLRGRTAAEVPARLAGAVLYEGPGYPFAVTAPAGEIHGELMTLAPAGHAVVLAALDALEGHRPGDPGNLYERVVRAVRTERGETVCAWVYVAAERIARRLRAEGVRVPGDEWPHRA